MNTSGPVGGSTPGPVLELAGVSRQFGAVRALTDVSFDCRPGEVHALVGENGSGKSTLLGIASGFVDPDLGTVRIGGELLRRDSPAMARKLGLAMAYQDTSLVQPEPVKNNLFLAAPPDQRPSVPGAQAVGSPAPRRVRPRPRAVPRRPGRGAHAVRTPALRGGQGAGHQPEGPAPRRADHRAGPGRGRGAPPHRRRLPESGRRRRVRQPPPPRGARDRRPDHRAQGRSQPGHVRGAGHHRVGAGRADRGPSLRGGVPFACVPPPPRSARCSWWMGSRASRSARSASPSTPARSSASPVPRATGSPSCSTASPAGSPRRRDGSSATARSCR